MGTIRQTKYLSHIKTKGILLLYIETKFELFLLHLYS